jgi:hypothetical protein
MRIHKKAIEGIIVIKDSEIKIISIISIKVTKIIFIITR